MYFCSKFLILSSLLPSIALADCEVWPNAFAKQIAAVRRRSGLTRREYHEYHSLVHGQKSWNEPNDNNKPLAYIQDFVFDSAFGANDSVPTQDYSGRDDITELYSRTESSFLSTPLTNYTETVIGPDGANFNDLPSAFSMFAFETFPGVDDACSSSPSTDSVAAFYWINANDQSVDNATFAQNVFTSLVSQLPDSTIYNASIHTPVPGVDSRTYYGGFGLPAINTVLKLWLCDTSTAVTSVRAAQKNLDASLGINVDTSFILFTKQLVIWDDVTATQFSTERIQSFIDAQLNFS